MWNNKLPHIEPLYTRRDFLMRGGAGFGALALTYLMTADKLLGADKAKSPLAANATCQEFAAVALVSLTVTVAVRPLPQLLPTCNVAVPVGVVVVPDPDPEDPVEPEPVDPDVPVVVGRPERGAEPVGHPRRTVHGGRPPLRGHRSVTAGERDHHDRHRS